MVLALLLACGTDTCEVESVDVADDAPLGDLPFTAAEVAAAVTGERTVSVTGVSEEGSVATLAISRSADSAVFHDAMLHQRLELDDVDFFSQDYEIEASCVDDVEVPVSISLRAVEVGVDIGFSGVAVPAPWSAMPAALGDVLIAQTLPLDTATLPLPPAGASGAFVQVIFNTGDLVELRMAWSITEGGSSSSEDILEFTSSGAE